MASQMGRDGHLPLRLERPETHSIQHRHSAALPVGRAAHGQRFELVEKYIAMMKEGILKMGASIDWTTEYKTMDPNYWRRTQLSFILLHKKDYMYRGTHPVTWCPRD